MLLDNESVPGNALGHLLRLSAGVFLAGFMHCSFLTVKFWRNQPIACRFSAF